MSDVIFVTENTESSEKQSENNNEFRKEQHKKGAKNMEEKQTGAHLARKSKERHLVDN